MEAALVPSDTLPTPTANANAKRTSRLGIALSALPVAFLLFDCSVKLLDLPMVEEASARIGLPARLSRGLGVLEALLLVLYLVPRTAVLGAVLWTGYFGGAIAIHLRIGDPLFSHTLFPLYVAAPLWIGLFLRDGRLRAFVLHTSR